MRDNGLHAGRRAVRAHHFLDHATTGDGVIAALRVLAVMVRKQKPLSELARTMTAIRRCCSTSPSTQASVRGDAVGAEADREGRSELGSDGRVVVRYSGPESKARVMIEGTDESGIRAYAPRSPTR
jgi:phosphoglucosamine mutase